LVVATKTRILGEYSSNLYPLGMINEVIHTGPGKEYIMVFYYLVALPNCVCERTRRRL
jgi:hypothetical protein